MIQETVAKDTDTASKTTVEDQGAPEKDLDTLLSEIDKEFDQGTKASETKSTTAPDDVAQLKQTVSYLLEQTTRGDIESAVESVSKTLGDELKVPRRAIRAMLNDMAIEDPRIRKAFDNRHKDTVGWNKVLKAAAKSIRNEFSGLPDKQLTDDREAVAATIRGASKTTSQDDAPNLNAMSDQEYETWKRKAK